MDETKLFEMLAKLRDTFNGAAIAIDEAIQGQSKITLKEYDVEKIKWEPKTGNKGPYESTDDANNPEFKALRNDLRDHNGKMNIKGMFYWVFENGVTVGRKKSTYGNNK